MSHTQAVTDAIQSSDYVRLSVIFSTQWQSLGQVIFQYLLFALLCCLYLFSYIMISHYILLLRLYIKSLYRLSPTPPLFYHISVYNTHLYIIISHKKRVSNEHLPHTLSKLQWHPHHSFQMPSNHHKS